MLRFFSLKRILLLTFVLNGSYVHAAFDSKSAPETAAKTVASRVVGSSFENLSSAGRGKAKERYKDGELLVKFKAGTPEEGKKRVHKKHGAEKLKEFSKLRLHHLKLKKGMSVEDAVKRYQADPEVEYAEPNFRYSIQAQPNEARFGELWGLQNTGQTGGTPGADIKAPAAWDVSTGSSNVVVAIIDTGIDYNHPDLAGNIWSDPGLDAINDDLDPFDDNGHGTHVAGTIGALGNNGTGVVGVNWNVKLTACKFLSADGEGYTDGAIRCLEYVKSLKDAGANIVATNNSWGGGAFSQALYDAINAQRDILFIAAAGNNGFNIDGSLPYPGAYKLPNIISVAATDHNDQKALFSNYGKRSVHLSAPGAAILSTLPAVNHWGLAGGYGVLSGTSMAAPHVTGVAAIIKAQHPEHDWRAVKNLLLSGGDDAPGVYGRTITGKRLSASGSLSCSGNRLFSVLQAPTTLVVDTPVTLSALSIDCAAPVGPVTVTLSGAETVTLADDGVSPDLAAGDGIFTANWTPTRADEVLRFSSAAGAETVEFPPMGVATAFLPSSSLNNAYLQPLSVSAGFAPFTWAVVLGTLPPGVTVDSAGVVSGTPTSQGSYYFTVEVSDLYGAKAMKELSLAVNPQGVSESWRRMAYPGAGIGLSDYAVGKITDIAVDGSGNSYVASRLGFGTDFDFFLIKYDPSGNELWTKKYREGSHEFSDAVAIDKDGDVYVAGTYSNENGSFGYLLVKFTPDGDQIRDREYPDHILTDLATDGNGNVYVTGDSGGYVTVKYDSSGNKLWAKRLQWEKNLWNPSLTVDSNGNIYLTGQTQWFESQEPHLNTYDVVLAKYDPSGNLLWFKTYDNGGNETGQDVAVDANGDIYLTGWDLATPPTLFLMKADASGNLLWNKPYAAGLGTKGFGLALDNQHQIYVAGSLLGAPYAQSDFLMLKYDSSGNRLWAMTADGGEGERGERLALGSDGALFVTGAGANGTGALTLKYDNDTFSLNYTGQGDGAGSVTAAPGQSCAGNCSQFFDSGTLVTLTATAQASSTFKGWGGACTGTGTCTVTMDREQQVSALFERKPLSLAYSRLGTGNGTVAFVPGTTCAGACSQYYDSGTEVTLTATSDGASTFAGWGGACSGTGSCSVLMDDAKEVSASFVKLPVLLYERTGTGAGTVRFSSGAACAGSCSQIYPAGTQVTLTAEAYYPNSTFAGWGGACTGTGSCTVTMGGEENVSASFAKVSASVSLAAGSFHSFAVVGDNVWSWGSNWCTSDPRYTPVQVPDSAGLVTVFGGAESILSSALKADGTLWTWGCRYGEPGDIMSVNSSTPVQIPGLSQMTAIAEGGQHTVALKADGTVWTWGDNQHGQLGDGTTTSTRIPVQVPGLSGVVAVAGGMGHSLALKADGTVWSWGDNTVGQLGDYLIGQQTTPVQIQELSGVVAIATGYLHSVARKADGTVWTWGNNYYGQLGFEPDWSRPPAQVSFISGATAIAAGDEHTLVLKDDGTVWAWGGNSFGELGDGTKEYSVAAVQVSGLSGVTAITAGSHHSLAAKQDGSLWAWGFNAEGQLGDGTTIDRSTPVPVIFAVTAPTTTATPPGGTYAAPQTVTLTPGKSATIYYTLDGSTPTTGSTVYTAPLNISYRTTLKFFAVDAEGNAEAAKSETYTFLSCFNAPVRIPGASPASFADPQNAYAQALDNDLIQLQYFDFSGDLFFDREIRVALLGGYDCGYSDRQGTAGILGNLRVTGGTVKLDNIRLK